MTKTAPFRASEHAIRHGDQKHLEALELLIRGTLAPYEGKTPCQLFEGRTGPDGFPMIDLRDGTELPACHVAFQLFLCPIPEGCFVGHACGNLACVNPDHLRLFGEPILPEWSEFEI